MQSTVERALAALKKLPEDRREELAAAVVDAATLPSHRYSEAENLAIDEGLADAEAGRFVSEEELATTFDRFRLA